MKEDFLHFIWKHRLFKQDNLLTTAGERLEIIQLGQHNSDAGPDFLNAHINIDGILWVGNVEIHLRASDWARHIHHDDKAYDNVILHIVLMDDVPVRRTNKQLIPALILQYDKALEQGYAHLLSSTDWVPCCRSIHKVDEFRVQHFLERMAVERLESKTGHVDDVLRYTGGNWHEAFRQLLFRAFGFGINALPFELLAKSIPFQAIEKQKYALPQLEALLFGQAGLLSKENDDEYIRLLQNEYRFLQQKFSLQPIDSHLWKFLRLRPHNFPTIRIAQLAQLLYTSGNITDELLSEEKIEHIKTKFDVQASNYWNTHFTFGKTSPESVKKLGKDAIQTILINMAAPFLFAYGKCFNNETADEKALRWLEELPPEDNHITRGWSLLGIKPNNAFHSQALLQLKTMYCDKKRCLHCAIGNDLLHNRHLVE